MSTHLIHTHFIDNETELQRAEVGIKQPNPVSLAPEFIILTTVLPGLELSSKELFPADL